MKIKILFTQFYVYNFYIKYIYNKIFNNNFYIKYIYNKIFNNKMNNYKYLIIKYKINKKLK